MRFFTVATLAALALGSEVSANNGGSSSSDPISDLIGSLAPILSQSCQSTVSGAVAKGSPLSTCLNLQGLGPILQFNNDSIVPKLDNYLKSTCSSEMCSKEVIDNTTNAVWAGCSTDLSGFGITENTLRTIMNAYPTARWISCISDNDTLCATKLLKEQESYLGRNISVQFIVGLLLQANGTTPDMALQYISNPAVASSLLCTDCGQAAVDIVLYDYPNLENKTFNLGQNMSAATIPGLYKGLCNVTVSPNATWPYSIKSTNIEDAGGSVSPSSSSSNPSPTGVVPVKPTSSGKAESTSTVTSDVQSTATPAPASSTDVPSSSDAQSTATVVPITSSDAPSSSDQSTATVVPITSTEAPSSSEAPTTTTVEPSSTEAPSSSEAPTTTTVEPTSTEAPSSSEAPTTTTVEPSSTEAPSSSEAPSTTTVEPTSTEAPSSSEAPTTTTVEPTSTEAASSSEAPSTTTVAPTTATEVPAAASSVSSVIFRRWY